MSNKKYLLGYDVGGTKLAVSLGDTDGKILGKARLDNKDTHPEDILPQLVEISEKLVAEAGLKMTDVSAFGISSPGPADYENGIMIAPPNNKYWRNVPLKKYISDKLGINGLFENDANCGALAEWFFGAGRNCNNFIYLTMSTGIGAGIVAEGKLIRGRGFSAGEAGHTCVELNGRQCNCGLKGCYEAYCGGRAIAQRIQEELKDQPDHLLVKLADGKLENIDMIVLEKGIRANDPYSVKLWDEVCLRNAQAFGMLIHIFNPEKLILGTLAWAMGDELFINPIKKYLPRFTWESMRNECTLIPSGLRREIGSYAGLAAACYYLREKGEL